MSAQAEYVRVPLADSTLVPVRDGVTDEEALLAGDILSTGVQSAYLLDSSNIGCHEQGADLAAGVTRKKLSLPLLSMTGMSQLPDETLGP